MILLELLILYDKKHDLNQNLLLKLILHYNMELLYIQGNLLLLQHNHFLLLESTDNFFIISFFIDVIFIGSIFFSDIFDENKFFNMNLI